MHQSLDWLKLKRKRFRSHKQEKFIKPDRETQAQSTRIQTCVCTRVSQCLCSLWCVRSCLRCNTVFQKSCTTLFSCMVIDIKRDEILLFLLLVGTRHSRERFWQRIVLRILFFGSDKRTIHTSTGKGHFKFGETWKKKTCAKPVNLSVASCLEGKILVRNFESVEDGVSNFYTIMKKPALPLNGQAVDTSSQENCSAKLRSINIKREIPTPKLNEIRTPRKPYSLV